MAPRSSSGSVEGSATAGSTSGRAEGGPPTGAVSAGRAGVAAADGAAGGAVVGSTAQFDDKSAVSSVTHGSKSTSTSALVSLVKEQVSLVRNLTSANKSASEELRAVQEEKKRIEAEYRKMQEQMRTSHTPGVGVATAMPLGALGTIAEDGGASAPGADAAADGWVSFAPPAPVTSPDSAVGADGFPTPPVTPSPNAVASGRLAAVEVFENEFGMDSRQASVQIFDDGFGPRATKRGAHAPALGNMRQVDEWSTVVYPSARNVAVAHPIDDVETQLYRGERKAKKSKASKAKRSKSAPPLPPPPTKKTIPLVSTDPAPELKIPEKKVTCAGRFWASFSRLLTFFVPDFLICRQGSQAKQAWREKVAIFYIMVLTSALTVGLFGFFPLFLCREVEQYTWEDIYNQNNGVLSRHREAWTVIHGKIYDVKQFVDRHTGGADSVREFLGMDASKLFPRSPPADLPGKCLNPYHAGKNISTPVCTMFDEVDNLIGTPCHDFATGQAGVERYMGEYRRGTLAYSLSALRSQGDFQWIVVHGNVYNVTSYVMQINGKVASSNAYLNEKLTKLIITRLNQDATSIFDQLYAPEVAKNYQMCLDHLFYQGQIDTRDDPVCNGFGSIMYFLLILVASILVMQCLCSLFYVARKARTLTADMVKQHVMVMIPCYNEGDKEFRKTVKSVLETEYPDDNKVMLIVADGLITGRGEACSTPETIAKLLGYTMDKTRDTAHFYKSIGANTRNRAFVYHGIYKKDGRELKYIVIIKCGTSKERNGPRAGNRGKRDSQLMLLGLFNRVHYGRELCDLDIAICRALNDLEVSIEHLKYLMTIDADTRVHKDSMAQMVYSMEKKEGILACCGETRVDNKAQSWVTIIQVYEYFSSHHMKKAFESLFGTVTCLPGCFTMYRIRSNDNRPLLACDYVFGEYARNDIESLHEKNLYHLGEDRMLTTLLLQFFSDMHLSFVPEAICWTIVPHTFRILLSQRRRWINSTFHNMWELLKVRTMCGVCICSMKTIVLADMISTMILPASLVYAGYFVYLVFLEGEPMSTTLVIVYAIITGCQMIIFILRSRWDYFFWFFAFIFLGVPVFYFFMPVYAFWHMDDLSWGQTRQVAQAEAAAAKSGAEKGKPKTEQVPGLLSSAREGSVDGGSATTPAKSKRQSASGGGSTEDRTRRKSGVVHSHTREGSRVDTLPIHEL